MDYISDWHKRKERHTAFWQHQLLDRCLCCVTALKAGCEWPHQPLPQDPQERRRWWTDGDWILARNMANFEVTYFAGDSFPVMVHDLGPAGHAAFFKGCEPRFEGTVWFDAALKDYSDLLFDENAFMYRKTLDLARQYVDFAQGRFIVGMPDAVGAADALSHLRGPDQFMMDLLLEPEAVEEALQQVQQVWELTYRQMGDIVRQNNDGGGSVGWLNTWAPGLHGQLQCDLSVMISPAMFDAFIRYELAAQSTFLDNALYHLDGKQQVKHLDTLLSVPGIKAIQWTNVAGQEPVTTFILELQRIQAAGKGLILHVHPQEIETLMTNLSSRGLYLLTWADTPGEAEAIVSHIAKLTRD